MGDLAISKLPLETNPQPTDYLVGDFGSPPRTKKVAIGSLPGGSGSSAGASDVATTSQTLAARSFTYVKADGTLALADATAEGKEVTSFVPVPYAAGAQATHYYSGMVSGFSGLTPGANYFLGKTPGTMVSDVSGYTTGNVVMKLGVASSPTEIFFSPQIPVTL